MIKSMLVYFLSAGLLFGCGQSSFNRQDPKTDSIQPAKDETGPDLKLLIDTSKIAILSAEGMILFSFKDSIPAKLTSQDLPIIEQLLANCVKAHNKGIDSARLYSGYIDLKRYKRQYLPFSDAKGDKKIFINCFCNGLKNFNYWKERLVEVDDGGNCFFNITLNLSSRSCGPLLINGPG